MDLATETASGDITRSMNIMFRLHDASNRSSHFHQRILNRLHQVLLIVSTILGSWLGMQAIHEAGHVAGAWMTGGKVARVVLHPLTISRTDLSANPHPWIVAWSGAIGGVVAPLLLWMIAGAIRLPGSFVLRFFAGFCLLANGLYIGIGSFARIGDGGDMLRCGSQPWQLWLFCAISAPAGLGLWHGQGHHFGFGSGAGQVRRDAAYGSFVMFIVLLVLGFVVDGAVK